MVVINILGGRYLYGKRVKIIQEAGYQIARREIKKIKLRVKDKKKGYLFTENVYLKYDHSGNGIYLYLDNPNRHERHRIPILRNGQWLCGTRYTKHLNNGHEKLQSVKLFVKEAGSHCRPGRRHLYR